GLPANREHAFGTDGRRGRDGRRDGRREGPRRRARFLGTPARPGQRRGPDRDRSPGRRGDGGGVGPGDEERPRHRGRGERPGPHDGPPLALRAAQRGRMRRLRDLAGARGAVQGGRL
ncbi:MAG: hypothetical protein AVDCRST_MAG01-01-2093, partial [uncultured Rubrobacteraceae bacterium]